MPPSVLNSAHATIYLSHLRQVKTLTDLAHAVKGISADGWRPDSDEGMMAVLTGTFDDHSADQSPQLLLLEDFYAAAANTMVQFSSSSINSLRDSDTQVLVLVFLCELAKAAADVFAGISSVMTMQTSQGQPTLQHELVLMLHQKGFMPAVAAACRSVAKDWKAGGSSPETAWLLQNGAACLLNLWSDAVSVPGLIQLLPAKDIASSITAAARLCLVLLEQQQQQIPVSFELNSVLSCSQTIFEVCSGRPQPLLHASCRLGSVNLHGMSSKVSDPGFDNPQPQHTPSSHQQQEQRLACADAEAAVSPTLQQLPDGVWDLLLQALPTMLAIEHVQRNSRSSIPKSFAAPTHSSSTGSSHGASSGSGEEQQQQQQQALEGLECLAVPQLSPTLIVTLQQHPECMASLVTDLHLFVQPALLVMYQWARQQQELLSVGLSLPAERSPNWVKLSRMVIEASMFCAGSPVIIHSCLEVVRALLQAAVEANVYSALASTALSRALSNPKAIMESGAIQLEVWADRTAVAHLQPAQAAGMLQPVLHLLSAAVLHTLRSGKFADQNQVVRILPVKKGHRQQQHQQLQFEPAALSKEELQMELATLLSAAVLTAISAVEPKHLAAATFQQPVVACAALEMTIRVCAREVDRSVAASKLPVDSDEPCSDARTVITHATAVAEAVRLAAVSPKLLMAAAAKAESRSVWDLLENHLYSLLVSCLKCCSRAASSSFAEATAAAELAETVAAAAAEIAVVDGGTQVVVCSASTVLGSSCTLNMPQDTAIMLSSTLWYVLLARALRLFGRVLVELIPEGKELKQAAEETASLDPVTVDQATAAASASAARKPGTGSTVTGPPATTDASAAGHHRLLEQCNRALPYVLGRFRNSKSSVWAPAPDAQASNSVETLLEALRAKLDQPPIAIPTGRKHSHCTYGTFYNPSAALRNKAQQQAQALEDLSQHAGDLLPLCLVAPSASLQTAASGSEQAQAAAQQDDSARTSHGPGASKHGGTGSSGSTDSGTNSSSSNRNDSEMCLFGPGALELCQSMMEVLDGLVGLGSLSLLVLPLPPLCCSNPDCSCMLGLSEINLVAVRGLCSQCKSARYCSMQCQEQHWPQHKKVCHRINRPPEPAVLRRPEEVFKGPFNTVWQ